MIRAKYIFLLLGIGCFIAGFSAPHQFATSAFSFIMFWGCSVQEKTDKEWEDNRK